MVIVAYLNRRDVRGRDLTDDERAFLGAMIRRSANELATYLVRLIATRLLRGLR